VNAPISPANRDASGAEIPNNTAARAHRTTPRRLTLPPIGANRVPTPPPKSGGRRWRLRRYGDDS
jgi:hypothetical protein